MQRILLDLSQDIILLHLLAELKLEKQGQAEVQKLVRADQPDLLKPEEHLLETCVVHNFGIG